MIYPVYPVYSYSYQEIEEGKNNEDESLSSLYSTCIIISLVYILYFILNVMTVFTDIILGIMYGTDIYNGSMLKAKGQLIDIKKWLLVNGLFGYLGIVILILLKRVYSIDNLGNRLSRKIIKVSGYMINILMSLWSVIGIVSFFKYNYNDDNEDNTTFLYNYIFIRLIISPLICIFKLLELYLLL